MLRFPSDELLRNGEPVQLGSRAKHVLRILVAHAGETVASAELMARVWPDTIVVPANLAVQINAVRQALGDRRGDPLFILNDPGRGYRFIAKVAEESDDLVDLRTPAEPSTKRTNLPLRLEPLVGRTEAVATLAHQLEIYDLVSIVGPAGVGKTSLALQVSQTLLPAFPDGVWFIDLSSLREAAYITTTVAATIGIHLGSPDPENDLCHGLSPKNALLIFDNCEHLLSDVARLLELIHARCLKITILVTSREPLRVAGEIQHHLPVLDTPIEPEEMTAAQIVEYSAVKLFIERVQASGGVADLTEDDARRAADICKRLDGIPLALEIAAGLVSVFGIQGLATRLEGQAQLPEIEMRSSTSRHRTLTAAFDWSYELLSEEDRLGLIRLAVLEGGFTIASAAAILGMPDLSAASALLARLHAKSLITSETLRDEPRFRLLETTRAFALQRLEATPAALKTRYIHARYYRDLLRTNRMRMGERDIVADGIELDNIRAALRFTLSEQGDSGLALSIACGAIPIWLSLSLMHECRSWLQAVLDHLSSEQLETTEAWDLIISLRLARMQTSGIEESEYAKWRTPPDDDVSEAYTRRPKVGDTLTRWVFAWRRAHADELRRLVSRHHLLVENSGQLHDKLVRTWVLGMTHFQHGEFAIAREELVEFLATETLESRRVFTGRSGQDRTTAARGCLSVLLCLIGETDAGIRETSLAIESAQERIIPQCEALLFAFTAYEIAGLSPPGLEEGLDSFVEKARRHRLEGHVGSALSLKGMRASRNGRFDEAETLLRTGADLCTRAGVEQRGPWVHAELALAVAMLGRPDEGLRIATGYAARDRNPGGWCASQLRRAIGLLHDLNGDLPGARNHLIAALDIASLQGAVAWQRQIRKDLEHLGSRDLLEYQPPSKTALY